MKKYIAIDIGASSGRVILGWIQEGYLHTEEVHRFENSSQYEDGHYRWNIGKIYSEIMLGLSLAKSKHNVEEAYVGIDTWAVDYCLIDKEGNLMSNPISYRDSRTYETLDSFFEIIDKRKIYKLTGIQIQNFNTLFQLYSEKKETLNLVSTILLIPDYLNYCLTGKRAIEMTNASTTQLFTKEGNISLELLEILGISNDLIPPLVNPGNILGPVKDTLIKSYNLPKLTVMNVASHDTASAIVSVPTLDDEVCYISSGTWSLLGTIENDAITTSLAYEKNYTNERAADGKFRLLKNIMGLWIVQELKKEIAPEKSFADLASLASEAPQSMYLIDVNDSRYLNPTSMLEEINKNCLELYGTFPKEKGSLFRMIYESLAYSYSVSIKELEIISEKRFKQIYVVGGGSEVAILNQFTSNYCNRPVIAGPKEATSFGNLIVQMIGLGEIENDFSSKEILSRSVVTKIFKPQPKKNIQFKIR